MAHALGYEDQRSKRKAVKSNEKLGHRPVTYRNTYKNYKPFNPTEIKEKYLYANRKERYDAKHN